MKTSPVAKYLGSISNRLQLAGGWIDQPFVSRHNPKPPGSMVVVQIRARTSGRWTVRASQAAPAPSP